MLTDTCDGIEAPMVYIYYIGRRGVRMAAADVVLLSPAAAE